MESSSGRKLVTIARLGEGTVLSGGSEVEYYAMAEEPIDYEEEWGVAKIPSNMTLKKLEEIKEKYCVPHYVEKLVPEAHKRAYFSRPECVAVSEYMFKAGMRLPLHPFLGLCLGILCCHRPKFYRMGGAI